MTQTSNQLILLSYVPYPITTAVYFERAFRLRANVVTVGPIFPPELIQNWNLQNLKLSYINPDIVTSFTPDLGEIVSKLPSGKDPDLFVWIESVGGFFPKNLKALKCPTACYLIDNHFNLHWHLKWAENFDYVFVAQLEYLQFFTACGINAYWLPLGCDPEIHAKVSSTILHDISFVGTLSSNNPRRKMLLEQLSETIGVYCERCYWDDMAKVFSSSKIVFNNAAKNDLNMRVFEVMSTGALLLTDPAHGSGQDVLFKKGEELAVYRNDNELIDVVQFYLKNSALREQIAARGRQLVHNAHTYDHRIDDLLAVTLSGKPDTFSAQELRERSLQGVTPTFVENRNQYISIGNAKRSFVIPVLDYSPASEYNILTLLADLEKIPGDVIVIFNNEQVAMEIKGHPRITRYAIMKDNIGVARAWNVGVQMAATPVVFVMNADLHVEKEAVEAVEHGLLTLDSAACVGPQGSFLDVELTRDYMYFGKDTFDSPIAVNAVSGFFFAVKLEHFSDKILTFENAFTPCYFEEWDLGFQIKLAGLRAYIVPTTAYDHHWSGSIRALREIASYGRSETAGEILLRNRLLFLNKWRYIAEREKRPDLLESNWHDFAPKYAATLVESGRIEDAQTVINSLLLIHPDNPEVLEQGVDIAFKAGDMKLAIELNKRLVLFKES